MTAPWQCPACGTWMAPGVTEHRCEDGGGVPADITSGPDAPSDSLAALDRGEFVIPRTTSTTTQPGTIVFNWTGSVLSERALVDAIQQQVKTWRHRHGPGPFSP